MAGSHSYHDRIQTVARRIEQERAERYDEQVPIVWNPVEKLFLEGAHYKLERLMLGEKKVNKALDDAVDVYNFIALFFNVALKRFPVEQQEEILARIGQ